MSSQALVWANSEDPRPVTILCHASKRTQVRKATQKVVLYELAGHHNHKTKKCFPSTKTIADESGLTPPTVKSALIALEIQGFFDVQKRKGMVSRYSLKLEIQVNPVDRLLFSTGKATLPPPVKPVDHTGKATFTTGKTTLPETKKETKKEAKKINNKTHLPDWLPINEWHGFVEMRKKKRCPMTERAEQLAIEKLRELKTEGHDPGAVLNQSTFSSWTGLFPLSSRSDANTRRPKEYDPSEYQA